MGVSAEDFSTFVQIVKSDSAISLEAGKEYLVETRLTPFAAEVGFANLTALANHLRQNPTSQYRKRVVELMTTNETSFFRDLEPFEALKSTILPELIQARGTQRKLTIWCAASSTGQEPYSIAMLLKENFRSLDGWTIEILATDLSREVLEKAKSGLYTQAEVNRGLPATYLIKYFVKEGLNWRIKPEIRSMVTYSEMNLSRPFTIIPNCDLVFIRNVLIYFEVAMKREILGKIKKILRGDGVLFLGSAETTFNIDDDFERRSLKKGSCYKMKEKV